MRFGNRARGFALSTVPSLDLVIYKMGGNDGQYDPTLADVPQPELKGSREGRKEREGATGNSASSSSRTSSASRDILSGDQSRDEWKPIQGTPFVEGSRGCDDGIRRVLELVCAAVVPK